VAFVNCDDVIQEITPATPYPTLCGSILPRTSIPGITERMLIRHLQELVADGIVKRDDKKTIPPCVYYSLSPYGRTLGPVVQMMCDWGRSHLKRLSAKR